MVRLELKELKYTIINLVDCFTQLYCYCIAGATSRQGSGETDQPDCVTGARLPVLQGRARFDRDRVAIQNIYN